MKREYAVDKRQRAYENQIRQLKTEERQLRAAGMTKEAAALRKKWRSLTSEYKIYSMEHRRAFYMYRCVIDEAEVEEADMNEYISMRNTIGEENVPKTLEEFQSMKYNGDRFIYDLLCRERKTISDIEGKKWTPEFKKKAKDTYYEFREKGIELTDHGVARLLDRFEQEKEDVKEICNNKEFNYRQEDGKRIKYYDKIAVIYLKDSDEVNTVIRRNKAKEVWHEI